MFRKVVVALVGLAAMFAGALGGLALAMRFPIECHRSTGYLCEPYLSIALGPLLGFVLTGSLVVWLAKRYYRRHPPRQGPDGQAA
jgi:hypothetical protein